MACTHYGIGRDGRIAQYCLEQDGACGNGILEAGHDPFWNQYADNPNWHSLSVETINDSTNGLPLSDPQKQTLFKLVSYWVKKYNIPLSNIKGHFTLQPVNRVHCPGPNFDWDALWAYLKGGTQSMPPTPSQLKAAKDCWNSFYKTIAQTQPPTGTGIFNDWVARWIAGQQFGPPITGEYISNDWSGNPITVQEFAHARCEWVNNAPNWYGTNGKI
jgi:hypothetical protein